MTRGPASRECSRGPCNIGTETRGDYAAGGARLSAEREGSEMNGRGAGSVSAVPTSSTGASTDVKVTSPVLNEIQQIGQLEACSVVVPVQSCCSTTNCEPSNKQLTSTKPDSLRTVLIDAFVVNGITNSWFLYRDQTGIRYVIERGIARTGAIVKSLL